MKAWKLNNPRNLERAVATDLVLTDDTAKVKVTKALLSEADVAVYTGAIKAKYPLVLGRFALGQVTEAGENSYMKKGDRVYFADVTEDECAEDGLQIAGETQDGFFRDFALADESKAYVLPASVPDEAALLIDAVAMAERAVDEAHISVGQHVLVVGGGLYGNILCQILIYHRAVPILADNNADRLARAKKSGIYYTFANDESLKDNLLTVTGGKRADAAIYLAFANKSEPSTVFSLVAQGANVVFCSQTQKSLSVNLENALKNNVTVRCVSESREFVTTAINVLANKGINYSEFSYITLPEEKLGETIEKYAAKGADSSALSEEINVFKFVL
ncbi:MAG: alcohol dehydrogenase catalytic domain-containing protein [Clostridia bacterium]|nr:alcohol dehydrogenase catalytic domain-containing protein [Clostridia bacterium]